MPAQPKPMVSIIVDKDLPTRRVFATVPADKVEDFGARQVTAAFAKPDVTTVHYFGPWTPMEFEDNKTVEYTLLERANFVEV